MQLSNQVGRTPHEVEDFLLINYQLLKISISSTSEAKLHINVSFRTPAHNLLKTKTSQANISIKKSVNSVQVLAVAAVIKRES